ncbi:hypothetical protein BGZ82_006247 [Podila clonocystis]|nr:hypothetical protein BGZ82_006247 [Podila clonocystis]
MRVRKLGKSRPISSANRENKNKATNSSTRAQDVIVEDARSTLDEPQDKPDSVRLGPVRPLMENKPVDSVEMESRKLENREKTEKPEPTANTANPERSKKPRKTGKRKLKKPAGSPKPVDLPMPGEGKLEVLKERETPKRAKESSTSSKEKSRKQMERSQAWRRLERSKKKEKRREIKDMVGIEGSSTINPGMPFGENQSSTSTDTSMDIGLKNDTEKKTGSASHSPKTKKCKSTHKPSSDPDTIKHSRGNNNFMADSTTSAKPLTSNNSATSSKNEPISQLFWNCSLCGSVWKQEKAWVGHLTSGQHMRRVLKTVRQTGPEIVPFDSLDILSANDPFGWGTGAGVVEEEDSEDDEAITEDDRQTNRDEEGTLENDDDDMDLEE